MTLDTGVATLHASKYAESHHVIALLIDLALEQVDRGEIPEEDVADVLAAICSGLTFVAGPVVTTATRIRQEAAFSRKHTAGLITACVLFDRGEPCVTAVDTRNVSAPASSGEEPTVALHHKHHRAPGSEPEKSSGRRTSTSSDAAGQGEPVCPNRAHAVSATDASGSFVVSPRSGTVRVTTSRRFVMLTREALLRLSRWLGFAE